MNEYLIECECRQRARFRVKANSPEEAKTLFKSWTDINADHIDYLDADPYQKVTIEEPKPFNGSDNVFENVYTDDDGIIELICR